MKTNTIIFASILFIILNSCSSTAINSENLVQGSLVFEIEGKYSTGRRFDFQFNQDNIRINEKSALGSEQNYLYDKKCNEILVLSKTVNPLTMKTIEQYFLYMRPDELLNKGASYGDTIKTITDETKIILGYECRKVELKLGEQVTVEYWYTDKIKPGIVVKETPLVEEGVAFVYELKLFGMTEIKYNIKSISEEIENPNIFIHNVPDNYELIVPLSQFSLDSLWASDYTPNTYSSFDYPIFPNGRDSLVSYLSSHLRPIIPDEVYNELTVSFSIEKNGSLSNIEVNHGREFEFKNQVVNTFLEMPTWAPAKVKENPVKSEVTILF